MKFRFLFFAILTFLCSGIVSAQSIFTNPITGTNPNTANPYTTGQTVDANITVSGIGRGTGIAGVNTNNRYNASGWNSGALNANDYYEFTLTPNIGYAINFVSLQYTAQASGTGATSAAIRSSADGFTANIGTATTTGTTISLSGAAYQNITAAITFRIYGWAASAGAGTFSIDDFTFNGTVTTGFVTDEDGLWSDGTTWAGGIAPGPGDSATVNHIVTDAIGITRNAGTTTTISTGASLTVNNGYVNNGTTNVNGTINVGLGVTVNAGSTFRVNGTCQINANGFFNTGSPIYGNASTLIYNTGGTYNRTFEWLALGVGTIGTTAGYPNNITLSNNTTLNYNNGVADDKALAGNLTIDAGSALYMDYGTVSPQGPLTVGGNFVNNGSFSMGLANGDDLRLAGNFANSGTFIGNGRAVVFTKATGTQTVSSTVALTIPYVVFDSTGSRTVQMLNNLTINAPNTGNAIAFGSAADVLDLNNNTLTIGTAAVANSVTGAGTFKGSATSNLALLGTGNIGTLSFTTGFQNLGTFTINRSSAALAATLGTALTVNSSLALTNGLLDVGNNPLTLGASASIPGLGATNYVIADRAYGPLAAFRKATSTDMVNYVFHIGDRGISADGSQYSPATVVNLSGATFGGGAYISVAVNDIKHPSMDASTDFITRYWDVQTSGVTAPTTFSVSATYTDADVTGTEANSRANRHNGTAWANTGSAVTVATNTVPAMTGFVAGGTNHFTAGNRDQEINVIHTASTTNYLDNSTYNFGSVLVGSNLDVQFTVQNTGQMILTLPGANTITGAAYAFSPTGTLTTGDLAGLGTRNFTIRFTPSGAGTFTGSITIPNGDITGAEAPYVINFTGVGVTPVPEINIRGASGGGNNIVNGSVTADPLNNTQFAATAIGSSSAAKDYEIQNLPAATAVLNLTGAPLVSIGGVNPGDFAVTTAPGTSSIAIGASTTFFITFTPTASGIRTAVVSIANNDTDENPYTFLIQGNATCATATNTVTPLSGPEGTVVTITASANNLNGATASFNGVPAAVTQISATQITVVVPAGATSGPLVTTNSQGCSATNTFAVIDQTVSGCEGSGAATPSSLFISQVTDSGIGQMTYIEIYNATGAPVNLNGWSVRFYNNGAATPTGGTINLNNVSLANLDTYTLVVGVDALCNTTTGGNGELANQVGVSGGINFNASGNNATGHDHIRLFNGATHIDSWGVFGDQTWATSLNLNGGGANFERKNNVIVPNTTYLNSDWNITDWGSNCSDLDYSNLNTFDFLSGTPPSITVHPTYLPSCKAVSFSVVATEGFSGGDAITYQWYYSNPGNTLWVAVPSNSTYSGATTDTLLIANISGLTGYQFYCEVREDDNTCYSASNAVMITGSTTVTWDGTAWLPSAPTATTPAVIDGNYNTAANGSFEACSLTVLGGRTLTVSAGDYVSIVNDLTVNATGSFLVLNNGSLVMIEDSGIVTNNGTMQVSRTTQPFVKYDYTYWSSPVTTTTMGAVFAGWRMDYSWTFNTANYSDVTGPNGTGPADGFDDDLNTWVLAGAGATLIPAKGYVVMGPTNLPSFPATSTVTFSGAVNNGVVTIPLAMSANAAVSDDDFNIIGNPYPSAVFADDFINLNTNTSGTVKFWTHQAPVANTNPGPYQYNFVTSDYAMYNLSGGAASGTGSSIPSGMIATGQGFLVEALTATNVVFNNSVGSPGTELEFAL